MAALVESGEPATGQVGRDPFPIAGVGAETVEKNHRRTALGVSFRLPLEVVEADPVSIEPAVPRCAHGR
jgi:hypothetical protein